MANEIIVLPYRAMVEGDRDYAVAFAVPANAKGLKFIVRPVLEYDGNPTLLMLRVGSKLSH